MCQDVPVSYGIRETCPHIQTLWELDESLHDNPWVQGLALPPLRFEDYKDHLVYMDQDKVVCTEAVLTVYQLGITMILCILPPVQAGVLPLEMFTNDLVVAPTPKSTDPWENL